MKTNLLFLSVFFAFILLGCSNKGSKNSQVNNSENVVGAVLPFPEPPSASVAGESLEDSKHQRREHPSHLPKDAPNIIIVLMDDVGFGTPSTFGGEVNTPTLSRLNHAQWMLRTLRPSY